MKISILLNVVLAIALVLVSWRLAGNSEGETNGLTSSSDTSAIDNIMTRSSVRSYTPEEVADSTLTTLLHAAMAAPTAMDKRPWHFVVVSDKTRLTAIATAMPNAGMAASAPLAIVVCGDMNKADSDPIGQQYWIQDCSAATENLLLAAHALDLGAVWCGVTPIAERVAETRRIVNLPDSLVPLGIVVIGHPEGTPRVKDKWNPDDVTYLK